MCPRYTECVGLGLSVGMCCPALDDTMLACCNGTQNVGMVLNEWLVYIYADQAVVDRDNAWNEMLPLQNFGPGGSKTNSLYWAASRPPALTNFTVSFHEPQHADFLQPSCSANSPCDILGKLN